MKPIWLEPTYHRRRAELWEAAGYAAIALAGRATGFRVATKGGRPPLVAAAWAWRARPIDGNGKDGVEAIDAFVGKLEAGFDYVQGSRYIGGGRAINTPIDRKIGGRLLHAPLLSLFGRHWYTDTTNGFRAYSAGYLLDPRVAPFRSVFGRYELLFYLTVRAGQLGYKVVEIPVTRAYPGGERPPTKISGFRGRLGILRELVAAATGRFNPG